MSSSISQQPPPPPAIIPSTPRTNSEVPSQQSVVPSAPPLPLDQLLSELPPYALPVTNNNQTPPEALPVTDSIENRQNEQNSQTQIVQNSTSEKDIISESYYKLLDLNKTKIKRKILYCKMCGFQYIPELIRVDDHNYFFCVECQESLQTTLKKKSSFCCLM